MVIDSFGSSVMQSVARSRLVDGGLFAEGERTKSGYMKRVLLYIIAIIAGLFILAVAWSQYPTLGKQVQFNQSVWERSHKPLDRIRYYMSDSLVEKLKDDQPTIEEAVELLGVNHLVAGDYRSSDRSLYYFIGCPPFYIMGLEMWVLWIGFNEDGSFKDAEVALWD